MLAAHEDALVCDLAETYGVFDWRGLPVRTLAALAVGLGENSRTKRALSGAKLPLTEMLLAAVADCLRTLVWFQTKDGVKGRNRPDSILEILEGTQQKTGEVRMFESGDDFEAARNKLLEGVK